MNINPCFICRCQKMKFRWIPLYGFGVSLDSSLLVEISGGCCLGRC